MVPLRSCRSAGAGAYSLARAPGSPASRDPATVDATELLKRLWAGKGLGTRAPSAQCILSSMRKSEGAGKRGEQ